ncbi:MAG: hypothetical protein LBH98_08250 [Chitinispirillales bacterium]|jgi:DnaJ-class molecular chaperone|nr:hypothetical protein [Chitinispirillales bacterium]
MRKFCIALIAVIVLLNGCSTEIECGRCDGKGYIFFDNNYNRETCPVCGGTGKLKK